MTPSEMQVVQSPNAGTIDSNDIDLRSTQVDRRHDEAGLGRQ